MQGRKKAYFESAHYTLYWKLTDEERRDPNAHLYAGYVARRSLGSVKAGDVLWIVNLHLGRLYLVGRMKVALVTSDTGFALEFVNSDKHWQDAEWYAVADRREVEPLRLVDITERVPAYLYAGVETPIVRPFEAIQFRGLRALTDEATELLSGIWYAYQDEAQATRDYVQDYLELTEDDRAYTEGRLVMRTLQERQRSRRLVRQAKQRYRRRDRTLACEACGFSFLDTYGVEYIEAHHADQMASFSGEHQTRVEDLHLLCANCHRVIHSHTPPLSIEQLKDLLQSRRGLHTLKEQP